MLLGAFGTRQTRQRTEKRTRFKSGVIERGVFAFACQYIVSLHCRAGNRIVTQIRHAIPCWQTTKPLATTVSVRRVAAAWYSTFVPVATPMSLHVFAYPLLNFPTRKARQGWLPGMEARHPLKPPFIRRQSSCKGFCALGPRNPQIISNKNPPLVSVWEQRDDIVGLCFWDVFASVKATWQYRDGQTTT